MSQKFVSRLTKPRLLQRTLKKLLSFYYKQQWIVLISKRVQGDAPRWNDFRPLMPPPDRDWADPFLWAHDNRCYIFIEEKPFSATNAHITYLELDDNLSVNASGVALKRPYHLSYPFLFVYENQLYMMPETMGNNAVELYRCVKFPDQWEFFKTLIPNVKAVDATLIEYQGRWWLFANIEDESGSSWTELHLYSADNPLSDSWTPHPKNPIVKDVRSSRPAGNIIKRDGALIRPSQNSSIRYGYATNFMRIDKLTKTDYAETRDIIFRPPLFRNALGIHTWNEMDNLTVIDATVRRKKQ